MKLITPVAWISGSIAILTVAATQNNIELGFVAFLAGGVGLGTLFPALKQRWASKAIQDQSDGGALRELEARLRVTEDELATATRELTALREQHDFDVKLQLAKSSSPATENASAQPANPGAKSGV